MTAPESANRVIFAQTLQAVTQPALQRRRRIRIERHQIPQGLAAVLAEISQRNGICVRVPRHVFANRAVRMPPSFCKVLAFERGCSLISRSK